jgi:hypothetical protein
MPIKDVNTNVFEYPTSKLGVNLNKDIVELEPEECIQAKNLIWANGMVKRGGQSLLTATEVVASKKILGLHKFYKSDGTKQTLAACDTTVKYLNGTAWTNAVTGLTTGLQTYMSTWGALNKVYICNGTDEMRSWDGTTAATVTLPSADTTAYGMPRMALPYQDRLLTILGGKLTWSASFSDTGASWELVANSGVRPDTLLYGMVHHAVSNEGAGFYAKVLLAGANGMYLFEAKDLRVPFTTGDYTISQLAIPVGCNAPRTMCWTPKGTMWLGIDKQVYLLPFNSVSPIAVGTKIQSNISGLSGIEDMPVTEIENACATYHKGYYILSIPASGGTCNTIQWWVHTDRASFDGDGNFGPWYGPMTGQNIGCFANQNGTQDGGELLGGDSNSTTEKGLVYFCNEKTQSGDIDSSTGLAKAIPTGWQTYYNPLGNTYLRKDVHMAELEMMDVLGTVNVGFFDIEGTISTTKTASLSGGAEYWNDNYWGEEYWSSSAPARVKIDLSPGIHVRRLSMLVEHNISNDKFELYAARVAAIDQGQIFE